MTPPSDFDFPGTPRFEIVRRLGAGGMGVVYEAYDRTRDSSIALKVLRHFSAHGLYRFKREFRALQGIEHPNLCRLGELIEHSGQWFFTMELIEGSDFLAYVGARPPRGEAGSNSSDTLPRGMSPIAGSGVDEQRLRRALSQLAIGLTSLHEFSRVHRDVKPSNILVTEDDRVVLLDFGLSTDVRGGHDSSIDNIVGTPEYMAPEQAASKPVGPAADWYSVGVLLYQALTGHLPFVGKALEIFMNKQSHEPAPPRARVPDVSRDLDALCVDLLRFDPAARPSGREILQRLGVDDAQQESPLASSQFSQMTPFIGRVEEMAALRAALDEVRCGQTVTLFVRGESGVGKSELVRQFTRRVADEDSHVVLLEARCYERESVPYKAFDGIADSISRELVRASDHDVARMLPPNAGLLGQLFPVLRRVEAIASSGTRKLEVGPHELRRRMFDALRDLLTRMARRHTLVLFIDDFQWADPDSLTLLDELLHPPNPPTVLLLATLRSENQANLERYRSVHGHTGGDVRVFDVGKLPPASSRELVGAVAPQIARDRPELIDTIATEAQGHPLFILELVRHLEEGAHPTPGQMRLDDALWERILRLRAPVRSLLELVCVAGAPVVQEVARHATRTSYEEHEKATSLLRVAYLVRTGGARDSDAIEPYHDRVREAVMARIDDDTRQHHHERLAIALERAGAGTYDPQALVRHLAASGKELDAAQRAEEAAKRASEALAFDRAAELYRAAIKLGAGRRGVELDRALAEALANAGRGVEAAAAYLRAAADADPATRLECRRLAAEQLLCSGHIDRGLEEYRALLDQMGIALPKTPRRALSSLLWSRARVRLRGLRWKEKHESEISDAELTRVDTYRTVGQALGMVDTIRGADFQARGLLAALRSGERERIVLSLCAESIYVSSQGGRSLARGRWLIEHTRTIAGDDQDTVMAAWLLVADGFNAYFEGRFAHAADLLQRSVHTFRDSASGATWEINTARMFRVFALKHAGKLREVEYLYGEYVRDAERRGDRYMETTTRRYGSFLWLALDRPRDARRNLEQAKWTPPEGRFHLQHWFEIEALGDIACYEGSGESALRAIEPRFADLNASLLTRIQIVRCLSRWLHARLLLAAAEESGEGSGLRAAEKIARQLERERSAHSSIWAGLLRGGIEFQRGHDEKALAHLRWVAESSDDRRMLLCASAARRAVGRIIGGDEGEAMVAKADADMSAERIVNPERMVRVVAPGLMRRRPS